MCKCQYLIRPSIKILPKDSHVGLWLCVKYYTVSSWYICRLPLSPQYLDPWQHFPLDLQFCGFLLPVDWYPITVRCILFPHLFSHHPIHPLVQRSQRSSSYHHLFTNCILWIVTLRYCMHTNFARCKFCKFCVWVQVCKNKNAKFPGAWNMLCYYYDTVLHLYGYSVQWQLLCYSDVF